MSRESIVEKLSERHEGVEHFYTTCHNNGCWDATCLIKCSVKDGKIVSIEPDDSVNAGVAREDDNEEAVQTGMIQARACPMGHAWRQELVLRGPPALSHEAHRRKRGRQGPLRAHLLGRGARHHRRKDEADGGGESRPSLAVLLLLRGVRKLRLPVRILHAGHHHRLGRPLHVRRRRGRRLPPGRALDRHPDQGHERRVSRLRGARPAELQAGGAVGLRPHGGLVRPCALRT